MIAPGAPEGYIRFRRHAIAKIDDADVLQDLLYDCARDDFNLFARFVFEPLEHWKNARERFHGKTIIFVHMGNGKLHVV